MNRYLNATLIRVSLIFVFVWVSCGFLGAQPALQITAPADGAVVNPGQNVTVSVEASGATFTHVALMSDLPIDLDQVLTAPPYQFTFAIPLDIPQRSYMLSAVGVVSVGQGAFSNVLSISIRRADDPTILKVEPSSLYLRVGAQASILVTGTFSDGSKADVTQSASTRYVSTAPGVVTVTADGRVTAVAPGSAKIVVNGAFGIPVTVRPLIALVPATRALYAGQTLQLTAQVTMSDESVTWSASPAGVGTLTGTGFYTAPPEVKSQQQVTITATSVADTTKSAGSTISLYPPLSVTVSPSSASLRAGQSQQFAAQVANAVNTAVTWSISPTGIGTLDANGLYTAPSPVASTQTLIVYATSIMDSAKQGTASVTVRKSN